MNILTSNNAIFKNSIPSLTTNSLFKMLYSQAYNSKAFFLLFHTVEARIKLNHYSHLSIFKIGN